MLPIASALFILSIAVPSFAQQLAVKKYQCIDTSSVADRLALDSLINPQGNALTPSLYIKKIQKYHVLVDVREQRVDRPPIQIYIKNSLKIPGRLLKTKTYLKNKSLVLIDDGFNHYNLEQEVKQLQTLGFSDIKIFSDGIAGLVGKGYLQGEPSSIFQLRLISAEKLLEFSLDVNNTLFINLEDGNAVFEELGLSYLHIPYSQDRTFLLQLHNNISHAVAENKNLRLVLSHRQFAIYREIIASKKLEGMNSLWYVQGGSNALSLMKNNIASIETARTKVKVSCLY
ncbi:hypothetical protein AB835_04005 [Candidatus Endobugula sertula]|uniref:Rhodanese domain-containing protein n=1 Tax=Candidatus Endobugula sertula TaxID=62101 RepID=A0A1D2QRX5_9GAMM|nr:hypothetical protein AB835_04005 [Candidatus Endobugula sertula]